MREIILDTETTGLSPENGDRVVEIAALETHNRIPTGNFFQTYINPNGQKMHPDAERITGIKDDFLIDKPLFKDVVFDFLDFIKDDTLVIHNAKFDVKFLNYELNIFGSFGIEIHMERCVDTLLLARRRFPGGSNSLDALCKRFNVDNSERSLHGALIDCELLASVYMHLLGGPQGNLFQNPNNPLFLDDDQLFKRQTNFPKREWPLSSDEIASHKEFIETFVKDSIWEKL